MSDIISVVGDRRAVQRIFEEVDAGVQEKDNPRPALQAAPLNCPAGTLEAVWAAPTILKLVVEVGPPLLAFAAALVPLLRELRKEEDDSGDTAPIVINLSYADGKEIAVQPNSSPEEIAEQLSSNK
jgi:hypothetical protein